MDLPELSAGNEMPDESDGSRPAKVPRLNGSELYKPPTAEELNALRDTEMLYHSNIIKLQITELLREVTLPDKKRAKIDEFLHSLHDVIMGLPITDKFKLVDCHKMFDDLQIPFNMKPAKVKGNMSCVPPADIQVVGSYLLHTSLKQKLSIDLLLEMPNECMQAKDYLNQRYFRKRAVYLSYLAHYLQDDDLISDVKFTYLNENPMKPVLLLTPSGKMSKTVTVRVHTCPGQGIFKRERFLPSKSNVRPSWFTGISNNAEEISLLPTPHYNSLLLSDLLMVENLSYLYKSLAECEGVRDGIKLLKVWLRQRELDQGQGSFSGFILSMLTCYLLEKRKINKMMSSYQVVRNVFQYLSSSDWITQAISVKDHDASQFQAHFEVVFLDPSGALNLCAHVSAATYKQVCHEAELSLRTLDEKSFSNGFNAVFIMPVPFFRAFHYFLHVSKPWLLQSSCEKLNLMERLPEFGGDAIACSLPHVVRILQQGLGSRVKLTAVRGCRYGTWDVKSRPPLWKQPESTMSFGFLLTSDYTSIIEKGPTAETAEAASFRKLWGDKSELRRFQDGAICEAVVWDCKNKTERRNLPERICKHILKLHCTLPAGSLSCVSNQIEQILTLKTDVKQSDYVPLPGYAGTGDELSLRLIHSFNELCSHIRSLKDLPLTVVSLQGISPALRYTEVYPPTQATIERSQVMKRIMNKVQIPEDDMSSPPYIHPVEVICHLEGSGKWPDEVEALRRLKAAFHITFAEELEKRFEDLTCVPTQTYLDVFKDGFVFRVVIAYHREVAIMQTFTTSNGLVKTRSTPQSIQLEEKTVHLPQLAGVLHGLAQKHPSFGLTCRLAKRWINGHMLSHHMPEVAIELLCAYLYTNPHPYSEPGSALAGFTRFLAFFSSFDFNSSPIIVNFNGDLKETDVTTIQDNFQSYRDSLPIVFIATSRDKTRSVWTRRQPTPMILRRIKSLAATSLKNAEWKTLSLEKEPAFQTIFSGSLSAYDVIIHLEAKCVARRFESCQDDGASAQSEEDTPADNAHILPVAGFDPVACYLKELEDSFGETAMFFYNINGGTEIGVLWRPGAFDSKHFKISDILGASVVGEGKVAVDVKSLIEDFDTLGRGLVSKIELRTDKWKM